MSPFESLKSFLRPVAWTLPFLFFFIGYQTLNIIFHRSHLKTPALVGVSLFSALQKLATLNLNARILSCKEDAILPEGTVISQTPSATSFVRPQQTVFLIVSSQPITEKNDATHKKSLTGTIKNDSTLFVLVPSFEGKTALEVKKVLEEKGYAFQFFPEIIDEKQLDEKIILDQKPLAGSFIDTFNPPCIQLKLNN